MLTVNHAGRRFPQLRLVAAAVLLASSCAILAQPVGEVEFSRGVGFAQSPGKLPRTLGKGLTLNEGDRRLPQADFPDSARAATPSRDLPSAWQARRVPG